MKRDNIQRKWNSTWEKKKKIKTIREGEIEKDELKRKKERRKQKEGRMKNDRDRKKEKEIEKRKKKKKDQIWHTCYLCMIVIKKERKTIQD